MQYSSRRDAGRQQGFGAGHRSDSGTEAEMRPVRAVFGGRDGRGQAMAAQIAAMRERVGRMTPAQIYEAASQLHREAGARGLAILESLAAQMAVQIGPRGGRGAAVAYLDVMAQAAQMPDEDGAAQRAEAWLALAALRLGN